MMTLENAKGLAEEVDLMEAFRLFGFETIDDMVSRYLEGRALGEILVQVCRRSFR